MRSRNCWIFFYCGTSSIKPETKETGGEGDKGCLPLVRIDRLGERWILVRVFPKSAYQPNEMTLTICNSISRNCFRLMRDWKLESLANGKEISAVPFQTEKEEYLWRYSTIFKRNSRKITLPFDFKPKFPDFRAKCKHQKDRCWFISDTNF